MSVIHCTITVDICVPPPGGAVMRPGKVDECSSIGRAWGGEVVIDPNKIAHTTMQRDSGQT